MNSKPGLTPKPDKQKTAPTASGLQSPFKRKRKAGRVRKHSGNLRGEGGDALSASFPQRLYTIHPQAPAAVLHNTAEEPQRSMTHLEGFMGALDSQVTSAKRIPLELVQP